MIVVNHNPAKQGIIDNVSELDEEMLTLWLSVASKEEMLMLCQKYGIPLQPNERIAVLRGKIITHKNLSTGKSLLWNCSFAPPCIKHMMQRPVLVSNT